MRESESRILSGVHWNGTQKEQKALFYLGASAETRIRNRNLGPGIGSGTRSKVVELLEAFIGNQTWKRESVPIGRSIGSEWYFFGDQQGVGKGTGTFLDAWRRHRAAALATVHLGSF